MATIHRGYHTLEKATPFTEIIDIPPTTSTLSGLVVMMVPVYDVIFVELHLTVTGNPIVITVSCDMDSTYMPDNTMTAQVGSTKAYKLVLGAPVNVSLTRGSHNFTLFIRDLTSNLHGDISGHIILHGMRRS